MVRMSDPNDSAFNNGAPSHRARAGGYPSGPKLSGLSMSVGTGAGADEAYMRPRGAWRGAGGRWLLWPLRAVLWAALLIIVYRGVTAIVANDTSSSSGSPSLSPVATSDQFPATLADAYALEFGQVYLNFNPATQAQREQELAAFVPPSLAAANPDLGWNGSGQVKLQSEQVAGITVQDPRHAVVDLLATVGGQLMELGVPIYASGGDVVVSGVPALLPAPQPIAPPSSPAVNSDAVAQGQLLNQLPAFFQAYANGSGAALNRFLAPGVTLAGLNGTVAFGSISSLEVPPGGTMRHITVTVVWQLLDQDGLTSAKVAMTYGVSVVDLQSGKWYVKGISASTEAVGAQ
jgi:conjugative transposon protein TcpC